MNFSTDKLLVTIQIETWLMAKVLEKYLPMSQKVMLLHSDGRHKCHFIDFLQHLTDMNLKTRY